MGGNETGFAIVRGFVRLPDYWDVVLVDTPPTLGYLSLAPWSLRRVVIPVEPHALGLPGVASVIASIERARQRINPHLELLGIVACRVGATSHTREVIDRVRSEFGRSYSSIPCARPSRSRRRPALRLPITRYAPTSAVANDYRAVAAEFLDRLGDLTSR